MDISRDLVYLQHIAGSAATIAEFIQRGGKELFDKDKAIQNGIIRELEVIGEACRKLSPSFKAKYGDVPWREIIGARDKLIHDYMGVDLERVWLMAVDDVPELKSKVEEILEVESVVV